MAHWRKSFFTIAIGQTISLVGSSAVQFALIWWLASETESPLMMAFSGLMAFLPQLLLGPTAGVWIDRLHRKKVAIAADLFMGVIALIFAAFFISGHPPYWSACVVLGIRAIGGVFHTPAIQSIIPQLVPTEELVRANGWSQFMQSGAFMLGPVLGALMYGALPFWVILLTDFVGALVASLTMASVRIPEVQHDSSIKRHFFSEMREGFHILTSDKSLWTVTLVVATCMVFFMPLSTYYPLMTSSYFNASQWYGSIVELLFAAGMMVFALVMGSMGNIKDKLMVAQLGLLGVGISSLVSGVLPPTMKMFWVFAACCAVMGGSGNIYGIPFTAYIQENVPNEAQGRVFSLYGSLMSLTMPVGLTLSGPIAQHFGVSKWFFITGIACILAATVGILRIRALRLRTKGEN